VKAEATMICAFVGSTERMARYLGLSHRSGCRNHIYDFALQTSVPLILLDVADTEVNIL